MTRPLAAALMLRKEDAEARAFAQREFVNPVVLEAGAGTGKTATLVARILTWCLVSGWEKVESKLSDATPDRVATRVLEGVVAITFTEAASAEMAERVEAALDEIAQGGLPETTTELAALPEAQRVSRAAALRGTVDRLVVQTIHAWCRALLRAFPLEAHLHPGFEVDADGSIHRELVREVLDEALREAYGHRADPTALSLAARGFGPGELEEALLVLVGAGISARELSENPLETARLAEALGALGERLRGLVDAIGGALRHCKRSRRAEQTTRALDATLERLACPPREVKGLEAFCSWLQETWEDGDLKCLERWGRGDFGVEEREVLGARAESVALAARSLFPDLRSFVACEPAVLLPLHAWLHALLESVEVRARARGVVTFQGLLDSCAALLEERPAVADQVRRGIDQLLVDEFQDTDARQCAIVAALALRGTAEERPGLFLVGDPKQSIYGWRSADLAAYEGFLSEVQAEGGSARRLSVNHRSVAAVLDEVDRVMPPIMRARAGLQPAFEPLVTSEKNAPRPGFCEGVSAPIEHWLPVERESDVLRATSLSEATRLEARALAADLRRLHDEHAVPWNSVGVLFRSRGDWDVYLSALREAGVPFNVEGDRSYYKRREIIDAAALVRCVLDPEDRLALVAALRCSAVGVPDAALAPLVGGGLVTRFASLPDSVALASLHALAAEVAAQIPAEIPGIEQIEGWHHNLAHFADAVALLRQVLWCEPGDLFVEALRSLTQFEVGEAGRFLGSWRAANLERFFCELATWLSEGVPTAEVLRRLRHAVAEEEPREEGRPRDLLPDAVGILTLHGAKGLAFEHVYLMQLQKGTGNREDAVLARRVNGRAELRLHGVETLGFCRARESQREVDAFERVRLLYVGMTRAKERLVMSWLPGAFRRGGEETLAHLMAQRAQGGPDWAELDTRCRDAGLDRMLEADALWVLPAHGVAADKPLRAPSPSLGVDTARVEAHAQQLARAGEEARARMQRPFAGRASSQQDPLRGSSIPAGSLNPQVARAVGTAVHDALEHFDTSLPPDAALDTALARLAASLSASPQALPPEVLPEATALLAQLRGGHLLARLHALDAAIIARELPMLVAPGPDDAALGFVSGAIDLLYRDPADGSFVVVDYKTDRVEHLSELASRAREHAAQGAVYQRAVQEALGLPALPRFDVWFLAHDREVCVETLPLEPQLEAPAPTAPQQLGLDF